MLPGHGRPSPPAVARAAGRLRRVGIEVDTIQEIKADAPPAPVRIERAVRLLRTASITGVRLSAAAWRNRHPHEWHGPPIVHDRALIIAGGYAGTADFYHLLERSLHLAGIERVAIMPPVDYAFADIRESAERLASVAELLGGQVDVVGHSEGGLMARWFVKELGGTDVVRHVVTLGTPNRGLPLRIDELPVLERYAASRLAQGIVERVVRGPIQDAVQTIATRHVLPATSVALRQMLRGSEFMEALSDTSPPGPTQYLAIRSKWDGVVPFGAADLPPAENVANVDLRGGPLLSNHAAIASTSNEAFQALVSFIRRP